MFTSFSFVWAGRGMRYQALLQVLSWLEYQQGFGVWVIDGVYERYEKGEGVGWLASTATFLLYANYHIHRLR